MVKYQIKRCFATVYNIEQGGGGDEVCSVHQLFNLGWIGLKCYYVQDCGSAKTWTETTEM